MTFHKRISGIACDSSGQPGTQSKSVAGADAAGGVAGASFGAKVGGIAGLVGGFATAQKILQTK